MRTTLTLDDDLAAQLKERAAVLKLPFKQVVNDTLRQGLSIPSTQPKRSFTVKPFPGWLKPEFENVSPNQLNAELEIEEQLRKFRR